MLRSGKRLSADLVKRATYPSFSKQNKKIKKKKEGNPTVIPIKGTTQDKLNITVSNMERTNPFQRKNMEGRGEGHSQHGQNYLTVTRENECCGSKCRSVFNRNSGNETSL